MVERPAVSKDAVAIPPNEATMQLTALVEHILVQRDGCLSDLVAEELDIGTVGPCCKQPNLDAHGARCSSGLLHTNMAVCSHSMPRLSDREFSPAGTRQRADPLWQRSLVSGAATHIQEPGG